MAIGHQRSPKSFRRLAWNRSPSRSGGVRYRRACFESLESRQLLSITLPSIANVTMSAGTSIYVPLNGSDPGSTVDYSVTASDYSKLTPVMTPQTNKSLRAQRFKSTASPRSWTFSCSTISRRPLPPHIEALVQSGFYDGLSIYRNGKDASGNPFVIQGGNDPPTGAIKTDQSPIAEEFNPNLQFTSAGLLAMARSSAPSTSSTEFFITEEPARFLDYNYTIFGVQTAGTGVISTIAAMPNQDSTQDPNGIGYLASPLTITSASIFTDTQNGVLQLRAPAGVTGTVTVTVTASDGTNAPVTRSFTVTIQADSASNPANPFHAVTPAAPTSVTFVPPTGASSQVTNLNNSDSSHALQFLVSGVTGGNVVKILADGNPIGQATASAATFTVTTDGSTKLTEGSHKFTAIQIATDQTVSVTESGASAATSQTADVPSLNSPAVQLAVDSVNDVPVLTAAGPSLGSTALSTAKTIALSTFINNGSGTTTVTEVDTGAVLGGIALTAVTGNGTWAYSTDGSTYTSVDTVATTSALLLPSNASLRYTPGGTSSETATITYRAWDTTSGTSGSKVDTTPNGGTTAFSTATDTASLAVNTAPVLTAAAPSLGSTDEDTAKTVALSTFINNGTGTTAVADADTNAVKGGIALTGLTGSGTWAYSTDGSTFTAVGTVSASSAFLVPAGATLRYTPGGSNGETATITYRAWDATSGASGSKVDTATNGGATPFSTAADTASLTVTSVNDAPVLTAASPSLGSTALSTAKTIALSTFINNGTGTTGVTDVDTGAVRGGIALTAVTGGGTWAYSTDGSTYTSVATVSATSALLLPSTAALRYTPTGTSAETATITYRAWDTTSGTSGTQVDTTANGGTTAFSTATDTASLSIGTASISGFVYVDTNNDGLRTRPDGGVHLGLTGVPIHLLSNDGSGNWTEVTGKSPVLTGSDGSYSFAGLAAGTYRIQENGPAKFLDGIDSLGTVGGTTKGTAGNDQIDVDLAAGDNGTEYNFGERGLRPGMVTLGFFLASSGSGSQIITQLDAAPVVDLTSSGSGTGRSTNYQAGGAPVAIAGSDAIVADADGTMLAWTKATITNRPDGDSEKLEADTSDTPLTSSYANGVLTLSGAASLAVYQEVLTTVKYSNTASSPQAGDRTITVVANDGITDGQPAVATVTVQSSALPSGYTITAGDSLVNATDASSTSFTFAGRKSAPPTTTRSPAAAAAPPSPGTVPSPRPPSR